MQRIEDVPTETLVDLCEQYRRGNLHVACDNIPELNEWLGDNGDVIIAYIESVIKSRLN